MSTHTEIRHADADDLPQVVALAGKLYQQHHDFDARRYLCPDTDEIRRFFVEQLADENGVVLLAESAEQVVGYALLRFEEADFVSLLEPACWLHDIYVEENMRGQGVGKALMEAAKNVAHGGGSPCLMLSVAAQNASARRLFDQEGFRPGLQEMRLDLNR